MSEKQDTGKKEEEWMLLALVVGMFLVIIAFIWGNYDKKSQVLSKDLKDVLSDDENADAILKAIDEEKSGKNKSPEIMIGDKKYTLRRSGKDSLAKA